MFKRFIIIIIIFHLLYYGSYIDRVDRKVSLSMFSHDTFISFKNWAYTYFKKENTMSVRYSIIEWCLYYACLLIILLFLPFITGLTRNPWMFLFDGMMYNGMYAIQRNTFEINKYDCKLEWYNLFTKHDISTPNVVGTYDAKQKIKTITKPLLANKKYILKPECGGLGVNVLPFNNKSLSELSEGIFIIQERINICDQSHDKTWHLRITTTRENTNRDRVKILSIYMMRISSSNKNDQIPSNHAQNGRVFEVKLSNMNYIREITKHEWESCNIIDIQLLPYVCKRLCSFHEKVFNLNQTITMGWDVMMDCYNYYVLEGNVCSSILFNEDVDKSKVVRHIKNEIHPFL